MREVLFSLLLVLLASCQSRRMTSYVRRSVWIDTDVSAGIAKRDVDDALALVQAFHSPELQIVGVSAVFGNAPLVNTYEIAKYVTGRFSHLRIPVYRGAEHAADTTETAAKRALARALKQEPLTLIAIGPLTNIASVLRDHPELASRMIEIVAVAGRRPGQRFTTGTKNKSGHRDFNFEEDPWAFQTVLDSHVPLTLLPFEISSRVWITKEDIEQWKNTSPGAQWLMAPALQWLSLWKDVFSVDGFNPFDTLAVEYVANPEMVQCESLSIHIETLPNDETEIRMQGTREKTKPYLLVEKSLGKSGSTARYCYRAAPGFKKDLMERIERR